MRFWLFLAGVIGVLAPRPPNRRRLDPQFLLQGPVSRQTAERRQDLIAQPEALLEASGAPLLRTLAKGDLPRLSELVEAYGMRVYKQGWAKTNFAETWNASTQSFPWARRLLVGPWSLLTTWQMLEPAQRHPQFPIQILWAMCAISVTWKWHSVTAIFLVSFFGLLRPT